MHRGLIYYYYYYSPCKDDRIEMQQQSFDEIFSANVQPIDDQPPQNQCSRKRTTWMIDYVSGHELSDNDTTAHFTLFIDFTPLIFEEVVEDSK